VGPLAGLSAAYRGPWQNRHGTGVLGGAGRRARREAVAYVRERYDRRAVETPWQHRYVTRFATS
jgi:hypothetical protein